MSAPVTMISAGGRCIPAGIETTVPLAQHAMSLDAADRERIAIAVEAARWNYADTERLLDAARRAVVVVAGVIADHGNRPLTRELRKWNADTVALMRRLDEAYGRALDEAVALGRALLARDAP